MTETATMNTYEGMFLFPQVASATSKPHRSTLSTSLAVVRVKSFHSPSGTSDASRMKLRATVVACTS